MNLNIILLQLCFQQYSVYFVLDDGLQSGRIQILTLFATNSPNMEKTSFFSKLFFTALNKPHASSTAELHFFFFFAGAVSINPHPLSWSSLLLLPLATGSVSSSVI